MVNATSIDPRGNVRNGAIEGSDMSANVRETKDGFQVKGSEDLSYGFVMVDNVFDEKNDQLAELYRPWKRCLLVVRPSLLPILCRSDKLTRFRAQTDAIVNKHYGKKAEAYFKAKGIELTVHIMPGGEMHKVRYLLSFDRVELTLRRRWTPCSASSMR